MAPTSSARRLAPASRLALASAVALAVYSACGGATAFFAAAPSVKERPRLGSTGQQPQSRSDFEEDETAKALIEASATALELSTLEPIGSQPGTTQNPPWATCFVEGQKAQAGEFKSVLEEWVMRGERENVDSFRRWRQQGPEPTSVRCMETSAKAAMEAVCLECVPHAEVLPFTPTGRVSGNILTLHSVPQCVGSMAGGSGYCKSGTVTMP
mmetsp:Transcript_86499/g.185346  ORF Transcript_86499/g.185346 Transcript_86499/m.185346 type:complete len:212 (-) Transcript_86499:160-795(-)